jgi:hypothetical protein
MAAKIPPFIPFSELTMRETRLIQSLKEHQRFPVNRTFMPINETKRQSLKEKGASLMSVKVEFSPGDAVLLHNLLAVVVRRNPPGFLASDIAFMQATCKKLYDAIHEYDHAVLDEKEPRRDVRRS